MRKKKKRGVYFPPISQKKFYIPKTNELERSFFFWEFSLFFNRKKYYSFSSGSSPPPVCHANPSRCTEGYFFLKVERIPTSLGQCTEKVFFGGKKPGKHTTTTPTDTGNKKPTEHTAAESTTTPTIWDCQEKWRQFFKGLVHERFWRWENPDVGNVWRGKRERVAHPRSWSPKNPKPLSWSPGKVRKQPPCLTKDRFCQPFGSSDHLVGVKTCAVVENSLGRCYYIKKEAIKPKRGLTSMIGEGVGVVESPTIESSPKKALFHKKRGGFLIKNKEAEKFSKKEKAETFLHIKKRKGTEAKHSREKREKNCWIPWKECGQKCKTRENRIKKSWEEVVKRSRREKQEYEDFLSGTFLNKVQICKEDMRYQMGGGSQGSMIKQCIKKGDFDWPSRKYQSEKEIFNISGPWGMGVVHTPGRRTACSERLVPSPLPKARLQLF